MCGTPLEKDIIIFSQIIRQKIKILNNLIMGFYYNSKSCSFSSFLYPFFDLGYQISAIKISDSPHNKSCSDPQILPSIHLHCSRIRQCYPLPPPFLYCECCVNINLAILGFSYFNFLVLHIALARGLLTGITSRRVIIFNWDLVNLDSFNIC